MAGFVLEAHFQTTAELQVEFQAWYLITSRADARDI